MKTTVKKLFLLSSIAMLGLFGAAINALPISFAHLQKGNKQVALIGDGHSQWTPYARFEPPYVKALDEWLLKLSQCQRPIHFYVEARQTEVDSKELHNQYVQHREKMDSLAFMKDFLHTKGLKFGAILFDLADQRTPQITSTATIAGQFTMPAALEQIVQSGIQSQIIANYKKEYGTCSFNDFFGEAEKVLEMANKQRSTLPDKAQKLLEELTKTLAKLIKEGKENLKLYTDELGTSFLTEPAIDAIARFCKKFSMGPQINPYVFTAAAVEWIIPIAGTVTDLQLYLKIIDDLNHHDFIVAYLGANHVARLIPFLEALGFTTIKKEGDLEHRSDGSKFMMPITVQSLKSLLNDIVEAANAKKEKKQSESTDVKDNALAQPANPAPNAPADNGTTKPDLHQCAQCSKTEQLKKCSRCQAVRYCSPECQKAHWKTHKAACKKA